MKTNAQRIADAQKAFNDLSNRVQALTDRITALEALLSEKQSLELTLDELTIKANLLGV